MPPSQYWFNLMWCSPQYSFISSRLPLDQGLCHCVGRHSERCRFTLTSSPFMVAIMVGSCSAQKVHNGSDIWTHQETLNSWMIWDPGGCPLPRGQGLSLRRLPDTGFLHDGAHTVDLGCLAKHESFLNLAGGSSLREGPSNGPIEGNAGLSRLRFNKTKTIQCKRASLC